MILIANCELRIADWTARVTPKNRAAPHLCNRQYADPAIQALGKSALGEPVHALMLKGAANSQSREHERAGKLAGIRYATLSLRSCEKIEARPRQGPQQVAGGKREARSPRLAGTREGSPGRATERLLCQSFLSPLPGLAALNAYKPRAALRLPGATCCAPLRGALLSSQLLTVAALHRLAGIAADSQLVWPCAQIAIRNSEVRCA